MPQTSSRPRTAAAPNPLLAALVRNAAVGHLGAQRALIDNAFEMARCGGTTFAHSMHVAEAFARLAASHGDQDDRYILAVVLLYLVVTDREHNTPDDEISYTAEALAILEDLADEGMEQAAVAIQMVSDGLPSDFMQMMPKASQMIRAAGQGDGA